METSNRVPPRVTITVDQIDHAKTEAERLRLLEQLIQEENAQILNGASYLLARPTDTVDEAWFFDALYLYCHGDGVSPLGLDVLIYDSDTYRRKVTIAVQITGLAFHDAQRSIHKGINRHECIDIQAKIVRMVSAHGNPCTENASMFKEGSRIDMVYSLQRHIGRITSCDFPHNHVPATFAANDGFPS